MKYYLQLTACLILAAAIGWKLGNAHADVEIIAFVAEQCQPENQKWSI